MPNQYYTLEQFAFISVSGPDAATYLQGQISCDIHKLKPRKAMMGCCCNLKGRMQSLFYLFPHQNNYILATSADLIEETIARLKQYSIFSKVTIEKSELSFASYGEISTQSAFFNNDTDLSSISFPLESEYLHIIFGINDELKALSKVSPQLSDAFNFKLILAGIPQLNQLSYEKFLPHELNLETLGALDFDKGCYTGQEVVARLHYRGSLKQHLYRATIAPPSRLATYTEIHSLDQQLIGHVVNSAIWQNEHALLAVIRDDAKDNAWVNGKQLQNCMRATP